MRGHHTAELDAPSYLVTSKDVSAARRAGRLRVPRSQAFYQAKLNLSEADILGRIADCEAVASVIEEVIARAQQSPRTARSPDRYETTGPCTTRGVYRSGGKPPGLTRADS